MTFLLLTRCYSDSRELETNNHTESLLEELQQEHLGRGRGGLQGEGLLSRLIHELENFSMGVWVTLGGLGGVKAALGHLGGVQAALGHLGGV